MTQQIIYILGAFILSTLCGFIFIPQIIKFCRKKGLYDHPDVRKVHSRDIPRLGGISFMPSMLLASMIVVLVYNHNYYAHEITLSSWSFTFFFSLLLIYAVGLVDDLVGLGAKTKFAVQAVAAVMMPLSGLYINNLYGFCGIYELPFMVGAPLTVFVIIFACNAINLIDGIDGLSAGLSFIALSGFLICFMREHLYSYSFLIAGLLGVLVAFLYFNIWGKVSNGTKIFMGDSGSLTLGFILGFLFVKFTMDNPHVRNFSLDSMALAYTLLIVPMFDVVRVSIIRLWHRKHIFQADKNHIHHKLMRAGLNQHQTLACVLGLSLFFIVMNLLLRNVLYLSQIVVLDVIAWLLFHAAVNHAVRAHGQPVFLENTISTKQP